MPGNPFTDPNWAPDLADTVERGIGKVRSLATDNAVKASRGVVFGMLALLAVMVAVPLGVILFVGAWRELFGFFMSHRRAVWVSDLAVGGIFMLLGFVMLRLRHGKSAA
jgi:hypothetical protein